MRYSGLLTVSVGASVLLGLTIALMMAGSLYAPSTVEAQKGPGWANKIFKQNSKGFAKKKAWAKKQNP